MGHQTRSMSLLCVLPCYGLLKSELTCGRWRRGCDRLSQVFGLFQNEDEEERPDVKLQDVAEAFPSSPLDSPSGSWRRMILPRRLVPEERRPVFHKAPNQQLENRQNLNELHGPHRRLLKNLLSGRGGDE